MEPKEPNDKVTIDAQQQVSLVLAGTALVGDNGKTTVAVTFRGGPGNAPAGPVIAALAGWPKATGMS